MNQKTASPRQNEAFKPVWGLLAVLVGLGAIMTVRSFIWRDIIPWRHDFAAAAKEAQTSNKPRLLYFTSDECAPCEAMKRTTWADKRVAAALRGYVPVKIDFLRETQLDLQFGVDGIPTMMVMDSSGRVVKAITGGIDPDEFLQWLSSRVKWPGVPDGAAGQAMGG